MQYVIDPICKEIQNEIVEVKIYNPEQADPLRLADGKNVIETRVGFSGPC